VQEQYPLPQKRDLIATEVKRILDIGFVQKLTIQVGEPILVERLVRKDAVDPTIEQLEVQDLYAAARNAPMESFLAVGDPMRTLFHALAELEKAGLAPKAFLYSSHYTLRMWLELPGSFNIHHLFTIDTKVAEDLPDDILLLVGCDANDRDAIVKSLTVTMDMPKEKK
jgi:hypothetical protein